MGESNVNSAMTILCHNPWWNFWCKRGIKSSWNVKIKNVIIIRRKLNFQNTTSTLTSAYKKTSNVLNCVKLWFQRKKTVWTIIISALTLIMLVISVNVLLYKRIFIHMIVLRNYLLKSNLKVCSKKYTCDQ